MATNASSLLLNFLNEWPRMAHRLRPLLARLAANAALPHEALADTGGGDGGESAVTWNKQGNNNKDGSNKDGNSKGGGKGGSKGDRSGERGPVLVLAVNGGVLDLVLNFLCSAQRHGIGGHGKGGDIFLRSHWPLSLS